VILRQFLLEHLLLVALPPKEVSKKRLHGIDRRWKLVLPVRIIKPPTLLFLPAAPSTTRSFDPEKLLHRRHRSDGIFLMRDVAEIVEHHHFAAGNIAMETRGRLRRNKTIAAAP
jgi:hypothetical protein